MYNSHNTSRTSPCKYNTTKGQIRTLVFILIMCLSSIPAIGQKIIGHKGTLTQADTSKWTITGNNIINKNSQNIGIGSSNPDAKLTVDINGNTSYPAVKIKYPFTGSKNDSLLSWNSADSSIRKIPASSLDSNIYKHNGNLTSNRTINLNTFALTFTANNNLFRITGLGSGTGTDSFITWDPASGALGVKKYTALDSSLYKDDGQLTSNRTINFNGKTFTLQTGGQDLIFSGLTNGSNNDSLLTWQSSTGKVRIIENSHSTILVDADRTSGYTVSSTYSTVNFSSASINVGSSYNTGNGVFTVPEDGVYHITINMTFSGSSTNNSVAARIIRNGSVVELESWVYIRNNTTYNASITSQKYIKLNSGDNIRIQVGGEVGTISTNTGSGQHNLQIIKMN